MPEPLLDSDRVKVLARGVVQRGRRSLRSRAQLPFPYGRPPVPASVEPIEQPSRLGADYETEWARQPATRAARAAIVETVLRPSIAVVAKPDRHGLDRLTSLDENEPAIFVATHHSHLDTSLLLTSIPGTWRHRLVVAAAADYFFDQRFKATVAALALGAVPLDRTGRGRTSAELMTELLEEGNSLLIYPEGGRSPDGWGQPFKGGAAYLSMRCDAPVVPIYLAGTGRVWRKGQRLPKPARTAVVFGAPMRAEDGDNTRRFNARIESAVASLGDELATDWWQARKRFHEGDAPTMTGPDASSWRRAWALGDRRRVTRPRKPVWPR